MAVVPAAMVSCATCVSFFGMARKLEFDTGARLGSHRASYGEEVGNVVNTGKVHWHHREARRARLCLSVDLKSSLTGLGAKGATTSSGDVEGVPGLMVLTSSSLAGLTRDDFPFLDATCQVRCQMMVGMPLSLVH